MKRLVVFVCTGATLGCPYIDTQDRDARYDQDGDGLEWQEDCDDQNAAIGGPNTYFYDADGDGYGTTNVSAQSCTPLPNYVENDDDCDDIDAGLNPETWWYPDSDNDSYGSLLGLQTCEQPAVGYYLTSGDCNDGDAEIHPGVEEEICNDGADNNCDGSPGDCSLSGELLLQQAYATYNSSRSGASLGAAVALHPDFNADGYADLLAGAPTLWNEDENVGAVIQVSQIVGGRFSLGSDDVVSTPRAAGAEAQGEFGFATRLEVTGDIDGDGETDLIVGAPWDYTGGDAGGAFFVLTSPAYKVPAYTASLVGSKGMNLGWALDGSADVSGDALTDVLVGAPSLGSTNPGNAYIHMYPQEPAGSVEGRERLGSEHRASIVTAITGADDMAAFGYDVAIGDLSGDGLSDILISAPNASFIDDISTEGVFSYECPCNTSLTSADADGVLTQSAPPTTTGGYGFGWSIELVEDVDGDGLKELLVGAPYRNGDTLDQSAAMLFASSSNWDGDATRTGKHQSNYDGDVIIFTSASGVDGFGQQVRNIGDMDLDGNSDIAIAQMDGTTYLFTSFEFGSHYEVTDATASIYTEELVEEGVQIFGGTDVNDDGIPDLVLGVPTILDADFGGTIGLFLGGGY